MNTTEREYRMEEALLKIRTWARAYPVDVFSEVSKTDLKAVREKIGDNMMSRLHASWARHITKGIEDMVNEGLGE